MPKDRNRIRNVAIGGVSVTALAIAGVVALGGHASLAQDATKATTNTATVAKPVTTASTTQTAANRNAIAAAPVAVAARPQGAPVFLRRPMAPGKVQWGPARDRSSQMRTTRKPNSLASRLPRAQLDRTRVPVILPREGIIDTAKAKMVSFGDAYALNMPQAKGIQITMYGNRSFVQGDKGSVSARPVQKLAGVAEDMRISQMEDGWTATFTRYGVVYSIDVSCDDIKAPDCMTDGYIRQAVAQFDDVTMGADAEAEANKDAGTTTQSGNLLDQISKSISNLTKGTK